MEAKYYVSENGKVRCLLCPHRCAIAEGKSGICRVRKNINGRLTAISYGLISALALDPIEKKPLYHFYPGSKILSLGNVGCNFACQFCQNHVIAQAVEFDFDGYEQNIAPDFVVKKAKAAVADGNIGVAYTYNEPTVGFEFMLDIASRVKAKGLKNVMVSNGFIETEPLKELLDVVDAFNIDLKSSTNEFYAHLLGGKRDPVLNTLLEIDRAGRHLEITYLVIPDENDNRGEFRKTCQWIASNLGPSTVLHVTRYFPNYHFNQPPTSLTSILDLYGIAREHLQHVYLGNTGMSEYSNTYCDHCGKLMVERRSYQANLLGLSKDGKCLGCGNVAW